MAERSSDDRRSADRRSADSPGQPGKHNERRKKQDWIVRSVTLITILGWICALVALLLIDRASPSHENLFTRFLNVNVASYWNSTLLRGAFIAILASFLVSVIGFIFNASRQRRKTDRYNKLLIIIGIASTVVLVFYLVNFSAYL